ncbi:MAG: SDR family NAD(P)-dependent oxidoreductase [Verrucomicrobia bacterium]|nr:SDR family NAD(P)-dependent oxidoreductase [Verrucomicrobiota bacterium]
MKSFAGKVIVVTGASRGIGQAICAAFGQQAATVVGVARSDLADTGAKVQAAGGKFMAVKADLSSGTQAEAQALVAQILAQTGRIDGLVNNAGIIRRAPAVDFSEADWNEVLRVNLSSPFFLTQAVAKWWLTGGREHSPATARLKIVNVASLLTFQGGITVPAYAASKHGIAGITKALANEWAQERINVNAVAPGYIATENTDALRADAGRNAAILARIPEGRWGVPEDIAGGIVFLSSAEADYLNGTILNIDGGWLAR